MLCLKYIFDIPSLSSRGAAVSVYKLPTRYNIVNNEEYCTTFLKVFCLRMRNDSLIYFDTVVIIWRNSPRNMLEPLMFITSAIGYGSRHLQH